MNNTTPLNQSPYLRTTREFPADLDRLAMETNRAYLDTSNAVNNRTISLFGVNRPIITGEKYYLFENQPQQALRQVYTFTTTANIPHGITVDYPGQFINCFGSYTDGTNSYGLPFGTSTATTGLITFYVTNTNIMFVLGAGAPALTSGVIVLSWLSET